MTRPNPYADLTNPDSALVKDALTRRCDVCKAKPGDVCRNTIPTVSGGSTPPGRLVHYARTTE